MPQFKLLVGQHIGADESQKPRKVRTASGDTEDRYPSRTYKAGDVVECDVDLVEKFGPQKFAYLDRQSQADHKKIRELEAEVARLKSAAGKSPAGESFTPGDAAPAASAVAPGGQVSQGHQQTTGTPQGGHVSGPYLPDRHSQESGDRSQESGGRGQKKQEAGKGEEPDDLDGMTVEDLRAHAAEEEIDLHGARSKADIVKAIRAAR